LGAERQRITKRFLSRPGPRVVAVAAGAIARGRACPRQLLRTSGFGCLLPAVK